jgi:hypothetical protein
MAGRDSDFSRRKFMATSIGALATAGIAGLAPGMARAETKEPSPTTTQNGIIYRTLGRTGLKVPIISMGAGACNDPTLVQACYEAGMRLFDTAASYAYGRNEQMVGNALHKMGVRDQAIITTKAHGSNQRADLTPAASKKLLRSTLEGSLRRLKTDHVDILYIHDIRDAGPLQDEAIRETLLELQKEGKTRFLGISTHSDMANVINATVEAEIFDVILTAYNFTFATNTELVKAVANAAEKGHGVIAMKTQAGGARYPNPETLRSYSGAVINSAALKWILRHEHIATTIPGISNFDHLRDNFAVASNLECTEDEEKFLSDNSITLGFGFCQQCSKCLATCPKDADIPNLMRTHMYAAQYGDFQLARQTIDEIPSRNNLPNCTSCDNCVAACANSVNIPQKISELKLIYA